MLTAVTYHYIRESIETPYTSIFGVTPGEFSAQLDKLGKNGRFLGVGDVLDLLEERKTMPDKAWIVTLDDGLLEQYEIAWPILKSKGIPAIFYVNTRSVEGGYLPNVHKVHLLRAYIDEAEIKNAISEYSVQKEQLPPYSKSKQVMSTYKYDSPAAAQLKSYFNFVLTTDQKTRLLEFLFNKFELNKSNARHRYMNIDMTRELMSFGCLGSHGHSHIPLGLVSEKEAEEDIKLSIGKIREWTESPVHTFSYPYGFKAACTQKCAEFASETGVRFAFTVERAAIRSLDKPMLLSRFTCNDVPGGKNCCDNSEDFWGKAGFSSWYC